MCLCFIKKHAKKGHGYRNPHRVVPPGQTHKLPFAEVFDFGKKIRVLLRRRGCSVVVTQQMKKMVLEPVIHMGGGSSQWKYSGPPIEEVEKL